MRNNHRLFNMRCLRFRLHQTICVLHEQQTDPKMCRGRSLLRTWQRGPTAKTAPLPTQSLRIGFRCRVDRASIWSPARIGIGSRAEVWSNRMPKELRCCSNDKTGTLSRTFNGMLFKFGSTVWLVSGPANQQPISRSRRIQAQLSQPRTGQ